MAVVFSMPLAQWLPLCICYFCGFIISTVILYSEISKRRTHRTAILFTTKWSKWFSIASIVCGGIALICGSLAFVPIACYFALKIRYIVGSLQGTLLGFYQLDRLYFCFSQHQTHTAQGYPLWVFVTMYVYAAVVTLLPFSLLYFIDVKHGQCFIDSDHSFIDSFNRVTEAMQVYVLIVFAYQVWDFVTLVLYFCKVWTLRKHLQSANELKARQRIMSILQRILMLTFLYEIFVIIGIVYHGLLRLLKLHGAAEWPGYATSVASSLALTVSMYLMQQQNTNEYRKFLVVLRKSRLQYLCCFCCLGMIAREIEEHRVERVMAECVEQKDGDEGGAKRVEETMYETRTMQSVKMEHSTVVELSVQTELDRS